MLHAVNEKEAHDRRMRETHRLESLSLATGVQIEPEPAKEVFATGSNPTSIDEVVETAAELRVISEKAVADILPKEAITTTGAVAPQPDRTKPAPATKRNEPIDLTPTSSKQSPPKLSEQKPRQDYGAL